MKAILVATIGTRDLMFRVRSGKWYNIGDDRMQDGDIIGEQAEVLSDLGLGATSYRELTELLLDQVEQYRDHIKPVIIGRLLAERNAEVERVYLIGTDQGLEIRERKKDTLYACKLIQAWLDQHYGLSAEVIKLGPDGTDPTNFEEMFRWWRRVWREEIQVRPEQTVWVCLKGGVGQASEASRISGLSLYGDRIQFFDFKQTPKQNRSGIPSEYSGPLLGTNYLWDRAQQQALRLLERYDYAGIDDLLQPYFTQDPSGFSALPVLIKAGTAWNRGEFQAFFQLVKGTLPLSEQRRGKTWWWMAYEQAQLAMIRYRQENTSEAMLHSFRAVEGVIWEWIEEHISQHKNHPHKRYPQLLDSICTLYPSLKSCFIDPHKNIVSSINLSGYVQRELMEVAIPEVFHSQDFKAFWSKENRDRRNELSHKLGGISNRDLFKAWGADIHHEAGWIQRILNCLNLITGQKFKRSDKFSLFIKIHFTVQQRISDYQP